VRPVNRLDRSRAAVAVQALNALRGLLETEHRIKEAQEFEERIAVLEERLAEQQPGTGYFGQRAR
jgi:cell division protein ZapA (FtsZ GTPase activity inhibitor)